MLVMSATEDTGDSPSWIILDETGDTTLSETQVASDSKENMNTPNKLHKQMRRASISGGTGRKKGKRKRVAGLTPVPPAKKMAQTPLSKPGGPQRSKKRKRGGKKKSVIVLDSDSEPETSGKSQSVPDVSIVEVDDDSHSVIVLSDDEAGVCSGTVSQVPKLLIDRQPFVSRIRSKIEDLPQVPAKEQAQPAAGSSGQTSCRLVVEDLTGNYIPPENKNAPPENKNAELYQPLADKNDRRPGSLRPIVIDGSNVAFGFSRGDSCFSSLGLKICVDYFKQRGHKVVAFVPQFRKCHFTTMDPQLLDTMEKEGTVSFTPSRKVDKKNIVSYDDRFIVQYADAIGGVIVSRDNYRDLLQENPEWKDTVHNRLLMYTWVNGTLIFPKDPLGRNGPTLDEFLRF